MCVLLRVRVCICLVCTSVFRFTCECVPGRLSFCVNQLSFLCVFYVHDRNRKPALKTFIMGKFDTSFLIHSCMKIYPARFPAGACLCPALFTIEEAADATAARSITLVACMYANILTILG